MADLSACMSSDRMDWRTPQCVLDRVRLVAPIGLDPCSDGEGSLVGAALTWTAEEDGLVRAWVLAHTDLAYVNCPYGRSLPAWMEKCAAVGVNKTVIALVPARPDTRWWREVEKARCVAFWRGRLRFEGAPSSAPFPSALAIWTPRYNHVERFVSAFSPVAGIWQVRP